MQMPSQIAAPPPIFQTRIDQPVFLGSAREYFGIWIVNLALTVLTLGVYTPWARVRSRRYFYQNTRLFNEPFDYRADPRRILAGFLILVFFYFLYIGLEYVNPVLPFIVLAVFFGVLPWLAYKAHRFFAVNSAYRNVTFRFMGTLKEAYTVYLLMPFLMLFTFGLLYPYIIYLRKRYFYSNLGFGGYRARFIASGMDFFVVYFMTLLTVTFAGVILGFVGFPLISGIGGAAAGVAVFFGMALVYVLLGGAFLLIRAQIHNLCWNSVFLGRDVRFRSRVNMFRYTWIVMSNLVLTLASLFLLAPWAKVRLYKYLLSCLEVTCLTDLDQILATAREEVNAIGDSAVELFDLDFGF